MKPPKPATDNLIQQSWWQRRGILYFFAAGRPPLAIKIGVTSVAENKSIGEAIRSHFASIQSSNHETVELLGAIPFMSGNLPMRDAEVLERELHVRFASLQRFKQHTRAAEWFNVSPDLLTYIEDASVKPEVLGVPPIIAIAANRQPLYPN